MKKWYLKNVAFPETWLLDARGHCARKAATKAPCRKSGLLKIFQGHYTRNAARKVTFCKEAVFGKSCFWANVAF